MLDQLLAAPAATPRANLRDAATAVLAAWDDQPGRFGTHEGDMIGALDAPIAALRSLLAGKPDRTREPGTPRKPREGTKQEQVLAMLPSVPMTMRHRPPGSLPLSATGETEVD